MLGTGKKTTSYISHMTSATRNFQCEALQFQHFLHIGPMTLPLRPDPML